MTTREATCNCGQLSVQARGEPIRISVCHCLACQRRTGSPFAMQARFERANVSVQGSAKTYVRIADAGNQCVSAFLSGVRGDGLLPVNTARMFVAVPVGAFADPSFPEPKFSVYEVRKHSWVRMPASAERMD